MNAKVIRYTAATAATAAIALTAWVLAPNFLKGSQASESQSQGISTQSPVLLAETHTEEAQAQDFTNIPPGQVLRRLNLSDTQLRQMKAIRDNNKSEIQTTTQQLQAAQTELQSLMSNSASSDRLREKFNQVQGLRQKLGQIHFERMLATREVLTPQQRGQLVEFLKQRRHERRKPFLGR
ncbi:Spy/CpxP family protein refolding chaperone [Tumidithrix elongata RA019]|uniref:Spy/CpxP family protein refolding chaperone n=1 Tax=Tumidithrix elongata BACA0141 TaxID=2716417 RepID=A0AAW9PSC5_9CYAN|nr:Spy/CpxP family protein refolding chaperone [Tumidithrix elongata RA019]